MNVQTRQIFRADKKRGRDVNAPRDSIVTQIELDESAHGMERFPGNSINFVVRDGS